MKSVFLFAINRAIEICLESSRRCRLALTDLGHSRRKPAAEFRTLSTAIMDGFSHLLQPPAPISTNFERFDGNFYGAQLR